MSITPYLPDQIRQGNVFTWVNSQWKFIRLPGHFSAEINTYEVHPSLEGKLSLSVLDSENRLILGRIEWAEDIPMGQRCYFRIRVSFGGDERTTERFMLEVL